MKLILIMFIFIVSSHKVHAQNLITQTAREKIDVTVGFIGSSIEVFGNRTNPGQDIAIVIEGPEVNATVWKKSKVLGAWVNAHSTIFQSIPAYYQYASNIEQTEDLEKNTLYQNGIGNKALLKRLAVKKARNMKVEQFEKALIKRKVQEGVFFEKSAKVNFLNDNFFRTRFEIPASAPTGTYKIHSYLFENNKIVQHDVSKFKVEQVGLNAFIFDVSQKHSTLYALICIILAVFSGWLVSVLKVRP